MRLNLVYSESKKGGSHMDYRLLGARVQRARRINGLTQERLAEMAGISLSFMGHIERGTRKASVETLVALGVSTDALLLGAPLSGTLSEAKRAEYARMLRELAELM